MGFQEFMNDYSTYILLAIGAVLLVGLIVFKRYMASKQTNNSQVQEHLQQQKQQQENLQPVNHPQYPDELEQTQTQQDEQEQSNETDEQSNENIVCDPSSGKCFDISKMNSQETSITQQ